MHANLSTSPVNHVSHRILIAGSGGVGGVFGGELARVAQSAGDVEIHFLARGENKDTLRTVGLVQRTDTESICIHPVIAYETLPEGQCYDCVLVCGKTHQTRALLETIHVGLTPQTLIIPLQNGVDNARRIREILGPRSAHVEDACVYVAAHLQAPGVVRWRGGFARMVVGQACASHPTFGRMRELFAASKVRLEFTSRIREALWEKFVFVSPLATVSSYHNLTIGQVLERDEAREDLRTCLAEIARLALAMKVDLRANVVDDCIEKVRKFPYDAATSLQRDFAEGKGKVSELETFTGQILKMAESVGQPTPRYRELHEALEKRAEFAFQE